MPDPRNAPDVKWLDFIKLGFGYLLLLILGGLALIIGIYHVEAATSFGLDIILGGLLTLSGGFVGWAFREQKGSAAAENPPATENGPQP